MTATIGVAGIVLLICGVLTPAPFNGLDLLGVLVGGVAVIRTVWANTTATSVEYNATDREPSQNGETA